MRWNAQKKPFIDHFSGLTHPLTKMHVWAKIKSRKIFGGAILLFSYRCLL